MTLAVISPHLDDAAASLGQALAARGDVTVITVFAGIPDAQPNTGHDARSGFKSGAEAMEARRFEDALALAELGVDNVVGLDFLDGQYLGGRDRSTIADVLIEVLRTIDVDELAAPLGLSHPDHLDTARALPRILDAIDIRRLFLYAELPYAELWPELIPPAIEDLAGIGIELERVTWPTAPIETKARALEHYASQAAGLRMPAPLAPEVIYEARP